MHQIQAVCYDSAGQQAVSSTVSILVVSVAKTAPIISNITDQTTAQSTALSGIAFSVSDAQTAPGSLLLSATNSNVTLVPVANITFGGSGSSRTLTVTPVLGLTGSSTITVIVSDGALSASDAFVLTVQPLAVPVITSAATANGVVGQTLSYQIIATNAPTSYSAVGLPAGLTVTSTTGLISGVPTIAAVGNVTVQATNSTGSGSAIVSFNVIPASGVVPGVTIDPQSSGGGNCGFGANLGLMLGLLGSLSLGCNWRRIKKSKTSGTGDTSANDKAS